MPTFLRLRAASRAIAYAGVSIACLSAGALTADALAADPSAADSSAAADEPLSFGFIEHPPGERFLVDSHRMHIDCGGAGEVTVLLEIGLGGSALEWGPVRELVDARARTCVYDRAGYGWSDAVASPRDAEHLAREEDELLGLAGIDGPFVLVAHSFGGFVARSFAERRPEDIAGMVLVDSSHERQFERLERAGGKLMMPRDGQFVVSAVDVPEELPDALERQVRAFARMRKTYAATHGEMASFRESARQVERQRARQVLPVDFPITVIRRGRRVYADDAEGRRKDATWAELQEDLATLSRRGRVRVARDSGHQVHAEQPDLVAEEILRLVDAYEGEGESEGGGGNEGGAATR